MKKINLPSVLTIAGTDPSGGAGIQADIKTLSATGSYAASVITALTAQNTQGVQAIYEIPVDFFIQQLNAVFSDLTIDAVKIGMLHNEKIIEALAVTLLKIKPNNIVLDPVMIAKNGCALLASNTLPFLKKRLFPLVTIITPNIAEAEMISERKIQQFSDMESAAKTMGEEYGVDVLIKGGHLQTPKSSDVLYSLKDNKLFWFHADRIDSHNTHGTGCTLSSAIASYLAQGHSVQEAISLAKQYLTLALQAGKHLHIGHGCGPVHHFYFLGDKKYGIFTKGDVALSASDNQTSF